MASLRNWLLSWRWGILASWLPSAPHFVCHSPHPSTGGYWGARFFHAHMEDQGEAQGGTGFFLLPGKGNSPQGTEPEPVRVEQGEMCPAQEDLSWGSSEEASRSLYRAFRGIGPSVVGPCRLGSGACQTLGKSLSLSEPENQVSEGDKTLQQPVNVWLPE